MIKGLIYYLLGINLLSFLLYGIDKGKARQAQWRNFIYTKTA